MILLAGLGAEPTAGRLGAELLGGVALGLAVAFGATWLNAGSRSQWPADCGPCSDCRWPCWCFPSVAAPAG